MKEKFKSPVVWAAIGAQLVSLMVIIGVIDPTQSELWNGVIIGVCEILTGFGVFNNPNNREGF